MAHPVAQHPSRILEGLVVEEFDGVGDHPFAQTGHTLRPDLRENVSVPVHEDTAPTDQRR